MEAKADFQILEQFQMDEAMLLELVKAEVTSSKSSNPTSLDLIYKSVGRKAGISFEQVGLKDSVMKMIKDEVGDIKDDGVANAMPPKKPATAYRLFINEKIHSVQGATKREINSIIKEMWDELEEEEKKKYIDKEKDEKKAYKAKLVEMGLVTPSSTKKRKRVEKSSEQEENAPSPPATLTSTSQVTLAPFDMNMTLQAFQDRMMYEISEFVNREYRRNMIALQNSLPCHFFGTVFG